MWTRCTYMIHPTILSKFVRCNIINRFKKHRQKSRRDWPTSIENIRSATETQRKHQMKHRPTTGKIGRAEPIWVALNHYQALGRCSRMMYYAMSAVCINPVLRMRKIWQIPETLTNCTKFYHYYPTISHVTMSQKAPPSAPATSQKRPPLG